jgi:A/G-specific adenine glycosylase
MNETFGMTTRRKSDLSSSLLPLHPPYKPSNAQVRAFRKNLPAWYPNHARDMPWRRVSDPYRIWISEIMLQQTRVDQAWPYYERLIQTFPTVDTLAAADIDDVLRVWEGLGYYSRARNLHRAAQLIVEQYGGQVPSTYDTFRSLPGAGPYTTAAVLSIAFNKPYAVLDGNVARVLARVFKIDADIKEGKTRRDLQALADSLISKKQPGTYNQALMELGATICTPRKPNCPVCPLKSVCGAYLSNEQDRYPVTRPKAAVPHYDIAVGLIFNDAGELYIQRRPDQGLLGGLWEFPGGKREPGESLEDTCRRELREELGIEAEIVDAFGQVSHAYSHFRITMYAFHCRIRSGEPAPPESIPFKWVTLGQLGDFAFPKANRRLIDRLLAARNAPGLFGP